MTLYVHIYLCTVFLYTGYYIWHAKRTAANCLHDDREASLCPAGRYRCGEGGQRAGGPQAAPLPWQLQGGIQTKGVETAEKRGWSWGEGKEFGEKRGAQHGGGFREPQDL